MRVGPVGVGLWLLVAGAVEAAGAIAVTRFFVRSEHGQRLDAAALDGNWIGQRRIEDLVDTILNTTSVLSLLVATVAIGFIALIRRRLAVALGAMVLIAGANLTTQVLKRVVVRPELGVDLERASAGNSLPSGHATVAASVAVALVLVLPARLRPAGAFVGAVAAAAVGVATLSAGWHRPSDVVAALLIVGAWASAVGLLVLIAEHRHGGATADPTSGLATGFLALAGLLLLAGAGLAMLLTDRSLATPLEEWGRRDLLVAYGGGALGIGGATGLLMASVLATANQVVPAHRPAGVDTRAALVAEH